MCDFLCSKCGRILTGFICSRKLYKIFHVCVLVSVSGMCGAQKILVVISLWEQTFMRHTLLLVSFINWSLTLKNKYLFLSRNFIRLFLFLGVLLCRKYWLIDCPWQAYSSFLHFPWAVAYAVINTLRRIEEWIEKFRSQVFNLIRLLKCRFGFRSVIDFNKSGQSSE